MIEFSHTNDGMNCKCLDTLITTRHRLPDWIKRVKLNYMLLTRNTFYLFKLIFMGV